MDQSGEQVQEEKPQDMGLALGIDFGNSTISAAVWRPDKKSADMVNFDGKSSFDANLYFSDIAMKKEGNESNMEIDSLSPEIGVEFTNDKNLDYYVYDIKKLLGKKNIEDIKDINYKVSQDENGEILCFEEKIPLKIIAKLLFQKVIETAKEQFKKEINYCTVSVPQGFNTSQRNAIIEAATLEGIKEVFIINDPLSAGIYYISKNKLLNLENFLIIDFGSSKLDISLITISKHNSIRIIKVGGDGSLGGGIFDKELLQEIFQEILETYKSEGGNIQNDIEKKLFLLRKKAEKMKIKLTFENEAALEEKKLDGKKDLQYSIKRERFDELNRDNYNQVFKLINKLIKESGIKKDEINHIFLQGNAMRTVKLKEKISEDFPNVDICELFTAIPMGAAIYTAKKINQLETIQFKNFKTYNITPLSLGIRAEGDLMSVILPRGSRVPIKAVKYFITTQDNQTNIKFEIYAGERKLIKDNILLTKIMLKNLPQMNKGEVRIQVIFEVDENFILYIEAKEMSTNDIIKREKTVINEYLSQQQILERVEDAKKNEKQDLEEKERIQAMLKLNDKIFEFSHLYEGNEDILRELESYRNWIKHSSSVPKEEYEQKLEELNGTMEKGINGILKEKRKNTNKVTNTVKIEGEKNQ